MKIEYQAIGYVNPFPSQAACTLDTYDFDDFNTACDIVVNSNILYSFNMDISKITLRNYGESMHIAPDGKEGYLYTAEEVYKLVHARQNDKKKNDKKKSSKTFADLYDLEKHRERILTTPGFGFGTYEKLISAVKKSRRCRLAQFLVAVGIPLMGPNNARAIDEYFLGSWDDFEKAIKSEFCFYHIAGVSQTLSRNIYNWYADEAEAKLWRPVLKEITWLGQAVKVGEAGNPFSNANVVVTGTVNGMNRKDITELLTLLGANVSDSVAKNTAYLIVGENPGVRKLSTALNYGIKIITEGHFAKMLSESEADVEK